MLYLNEVLGAYNAWKFRIVLLFAMQYLKSFASAAAAVPLTVKPYVLLYAYEYSTVLSSQSRRIMP